MLHNPLMRTSVSFYHRHRFPAEIISHCLAILPLRPELPRKVHLFTASSEERMKTHLTGMAASVLEVTTQQIN